MKAAKAAKCALATTMVEADPIDPTIHDDAILTSRTLAKMFHMKLFRQQSFDHLAVPWFFLDERTGLRGARAGDVRPALERHNAQVRAKIEALGSVKRGRRLNADQQQAKPNDTPAVGIRLDDVISRLERMTSTLDQMSAVLGAMANVWDVPARPVAIRIDEPPPPLSAL